MVEKNARFGINMQKEEITGLLLAGGASSRMGCDKALLHLNGKAMIEYSIDALKPVCTNIAIIANNEQYRKFGYPVYADLIQDKGPLAGICTGLTVSQTDLNIIMSCDSPFITDELLSFIVKQADGFDVAVPCFQGEVYPLTAVYKKVCLKTFEAQLKKNILSVKEALQQVKTKYVNMTFDLKFFTYKMLSNINTIEDLKGIHQDGS
jgi:molybdopterin-guanine dinucleotide biosynthesis protein A